MKVGDIVGAKEALATVHARLDRLDKYGRQQEKDYELSREEVVDIINETKNAMSTLWKFIDKLKDSEVSL